MSKIIHHIHPHVMGSNDHRNRNNNHNNDQDNFFKHFSRGFGPQGHSQGHNGMHSFSATYSNVNGHVKRHFSKNGHSVNSKDAMAQMKKMDEDMDRSFQQMDRAFGDLGNDFGGDFLGNDRHGDHKRHPFRRLFGGHRRHHSNGGNLTGRIRNHRN